MAKRKGADTTTALVTMNEEMKKFAEQYAKTEQSVATGGFFGLKGGILTFEGAPVTGNKMCVIVLDYILENVYFPDAYDPDVIIPPKCYAFGREDADMVPHPLVVAAGHAQAGESGKCSGCRHNVFGSAETGKGKACGNRRRLAVIPAGTYKDDKLTVFTNPLQFNAPLAYLKLPVTSGKDFSTYVKQLRGTIEVPPFGVYTVVSVVPDAKSQFKVQFQAIQPIDEKVFSVVRARHEEATQNIMFPYPAYQEILEVKQVKKVDKKKGRKY